MKLIYPAIIIAFFLSSSSKTNTQTPSDSIYLGDPVEKVIKNFTEAASKDTKIKYNQFKEKDNSVSHELSANGIPITSAVIENGEVTYILLTLPFLTGKDIDLLEIEEFKSKFRKGNENISYISNNHYLFKEIKPYSYLSCISFTNDDFIMTLMINTSSIKKLDLVTREIVKEYSSEYSVDYY